jgi:hypothetical protein
MRVVLCACVSAVLVSAGCVTSSAPVAAGDPILAPAKMNVHPVFTKLADWNSDGSPDGVEVIVELRDAFGDPCKGLGTFAFELHNFDSGAPDPRGTRIGDPWIAPVDSAEGQSLRWSRTAMGYSFRLDCTSQPQGLKWKSNYVIAATFTPTSGKRLFDQLVLGPDPGLPAKPRASTP